MSKSGQAFVAATQGHSFTMYAMMKALELPLSEEQEKFQAYLERTYPAVVEQQDYEVHCGQCSWWGMIEHMRTIHKPDPSKPGDIIPELGCPICLSDQWLEYKED